MATAKARHILVPSQEECEKLKEQIDNGTDFVDVAKEHSTCPSGKSGGALGEFCPGQMVSEFDQVVFNDELWQGTWSCKNRFRISPYRDY